MSIMDNNVYKHGPRQSNRKKIVFITSNKYYVILIASYRWKTTESKHFAFWLNKTIILYMPIS